MVIQPGHVVGTSALNANTYFLTLVRDNFYFVRIDVETN
jgi:hypothetical protein